MALDSGHIILLLSTLNITNQPYDLDGSSFFMVKAKLHDVMY